MYNLQIYFKSQRDKVIVQIWVDFLCALASNGRKIKPNTENSKEEIFDDFPEREFYITMIRN